MTAERGDLYSYSTDSDGPELIARGRPLTTDPQPVTTAPSVVGLDLSLTSTGACWRVSPSAAPTVESWPMKAAQGDWRLVEITRLARGLCEDADLVVIGQGRSDLLNGAVRCMLAGIGVRYVAVGASTAWTLWVHGMALLGETVPS